VAAAVIFVCACVPNSGDDQVQVSVADEAKTIQPKFVSAMTVTSNCGVEKKPSSFNGFAGPVGVELTEMPENIAARVAVGADRSPVDTDGDRVSPGYVLIEPSSLKQSFLIGNDKEVVATFEGDYYPSYTQILANGNRLVSTNGTPIGFVQGGGGKNGCIEEYAANGELVWRMNLNAEEYINHHDVIKLDNGNILTLVWQKVSADEAVSQGRDPEQVAENGMFWYEGVVEVNPYTLEIVWEWSIRHHLIQDFDIGKSNYGVIAEHPERMNINLIHKNGEGLIGPDWTHANAMDYNPELDQIVISVRSMSEVVVIDHSTTPRQSAGHSGGRYGKGGDFLYRWGNPENYARGTADERTLFFQHDVQWILPGLPGAGNILVFNNGGPDVRPYTTVVEFTPDMNADGAYDLEEGMPYGPAAPIWEYNPEPPERFFSWYISGAQRLPNGNTFINAGAIGKQREVTSSGDIVWEYAFKNEVDAAHTMFRANKYPVDYPGLAGLIPRTE
jgi:hypothetical protein